MDHELREAETDLVEDLEREAVAGVVAVVAEMDLFPATAEHWDRGEDLMMMAEAEEVMIRAEMHKLKDSRKTKSRSLRRQKQ